MFLEPIWRGHRLADSFSFYGRVARHLGGTPRWGFYEREEVFSRSSVSGSDALLGRRILDEINALLDVALQTLGACLEQLLLVIVRLTEDVDRFLSAIGL